MSSNSNFRHVAQPQKPGHGRAIEIELPGPRITAENYAEDVYLMNQLDGINDTPEEEGMPLRQWLIKQCHDELLKNKKLTSIVLRPKAGKKARTEFVFKITE